MVAFSVKQCTFFRQSILFLRRAIFLQFTLRVNMLFVTLSPPPPCSGNRLISCANLWIGLWQRRRWRRRALVVYEECLGPQHDDVGSALNLLAVVVGEQGRNTEASVRFRSSRSRGHSSLVHLQPLLLILVFPFPFTVVNP